MFKILSVNDIEPPRGATDLVMAIIAQDIGRFRRVLESCPDSYKTYVRVESNRKKSGAEGPIAQLVIDLRWNSALKVLSEHGDKFEQPMLKSGMHPLAHAIQSGKLPAIKRLLALGAPVNGHPGAPPPLAALMGRNDGAAVMPQIIETMLAAGADPWALAPFNGDQVPLPIGCLGWGRLGHAIQLLRTGPMPESVVANPQPLLSLWKGAIQNGRIEEHRQIQQILVDNKISPGISFFTDNLRAAAVRPRQTSRKNELWFWLELLRDHMEAFPEEPVTEEQKKNLEPYKSAADLRARFEERQLSQATPPAPSVSVNRSPRL